jgi:hypothetical protein
MSTVVAEASITTAIYVHNDLLYYVFVCVCVYIYIYIYIV